MVLWPSALSCRLVCVVISVIVADVVSEPISFRISRSTEGLAETLATLSHRLVKLEQRLAAMELQLQNQIAPHPQELASLQTVETLLDDCRSLLAQPAPVPAEDVVWEDWAQTEAAEPS
jgi:ribosomal protein L29